MTQLKGVRMIDLIEPSKREQAKWSESTVAYVDALLVRIDELEAKLSESDTLLAKALTGLKEIANDPYKYGQRVQAMKGKARSTLAELAGGKNE